MDAIIAIAERAGTLLGYALSGAFGIVLLVIAVVLLIGRFVFGFGSGFWGARTKRMAIDLNGLRCPASIPDEPGFVDSKTIAALRRRAGA